MTDELDKKYTAKLEAEIRALTSRREHEFRSMQILYDLSREVQKDKTKLASFRARYKNIDVVRDNYSDINHQINLKKMELKLDSELDTQSLLSFDDLYYSVVEFAESLSNTSSQYVTASSNEPKEYVCLPKIQIPTFDGKIENWQTFKDSYVSLIHEKSSLSDIEKFHYLISSLSGFALTIAKGVPLTAANYSVVYNALLERYDNKRVLATTYLEKICNITPLTKSTASSLNEIINTLYESESALRALQIDSLDEFVLFYLASSKLDSDTRKRFELQNTKEIPTFKDLLTYLQNYTKILEVSQPQSSSSSSHNSKAVNSNSKQQNRKTNYSPQTKSFVTSNKNNVSNAYNIQRPCPCCNMPHSIYKCLKLQSIDVPSRLKLVNDLNLCSNCLRQGHAVKDCQSKTCCIICGSRHNTLVHVDSPDAASPLPGTSPTKLVRADCGGAQVQPPSAAMTALTCTDENVNERSTKILGSAVVRVIDANGTQQYARALIDSCSMDCFITVACARRLGLPVRRCQVAVAGLGQNSVQNIKGATFCTIAPRQNDTPSFDLPFVVLPKITSNMPNVQISASVRKHFEHLDLADDNFDKPGKIDMLLGVECFDKIYDGNRFAPDPKLPCALSSVFGWVITGQIYDQDSIQTPSQEVTSFLASTCALEEIVQRFWEVEEPPKARITIPEDEICEEIYSKGTYRDPDGRYVVPMMLKDDAPTLGDSYRQGLNRFLNIEKRLAREPELKAEYADFMSQYEELGHMQPAEPSSTDRTYIIPHHCVVRPSSTTTRLRVVFDASCRTTNNNSLNDIVHVGPKLQVDIVDLITKFRLHSVVFTADICKMYRQILISPEDRHYQHILWRDNPDAPLVEYELRTVTYGVSSSPYLAIRTLHQLADDHKEEYPRAAQVLREEFFVDDLTTGCASLDEAVQLKDDLVALLKRGQLELRKWSSNKPELLKDIPEEHCQSPKVFEADNNFIMKILGIKWDPSNDEFSYAVADDVKVEFTKRSILSTIAKIFDPLGWIAPVIISAKMLMQDMWRLSLAWDEPIPKQLAKQWHIIAANLTDLGDIKLPRMVLAPNATEIHLVGFCDGSSKGFGCCVYICVVTPDETKTSLLIGKSKVAPLKPLTVNRLELCSAVLLARVLSHVHDTLKDKIKIDSVTAFTDSTTVLSWLQMQPHLLKMFVANRVVQITDMISEDRWFHVPTHENPADCCSRGTTCAELASHSLWWSGPVWLSKQPEDWPTHKRILPKEDIPEVKPDSNPCLVGTSSQDFLDELIQKYSSLTKLQRTLAWCLRFICNLKEKRENRLHSALNTTELNNALTVLVKHTQENNFATELQQITAKQSCRKPIQKLYPFIDNVGLLRVGGRIVNAKLGDPTVHPILLPKHSPLSRLIIDKFHRTYLHVGPRTLHSLIQRRFWILGIRLLIRTYISKCVTCFKVNPIPCQPLMGNLPDYRVQPSPCFKTTGVDFAGPFIVKESKRRNARTYKVYVCLFICTTVKAVYIETVTELSAEAFLAALERFVSRRSECRKLISDCGTNFIGANRLLNEMYHMLSQNHQSIVDLLSERHITWEFNPPGAPHFGGIFESGIKSMKYHLKRVVGSQVLTLEELNTVLAKTEAILNSRPLCALSSDPNEVDVLTPGHFLCGGPMVPIPNEELEDLPSCPRNRWQMLQKMTQSLWRIWQRDYLHTLQQRQKWYQPSPNVKVNDVVILVEKNLPPLLWRLAKVEEIHPGQDGVVRVVTLKTANGHIFRRPVVKICPLPTL